MNDKKQILSIFMSLALFILMLVPVEAAAKPIVSIGTVAGTAGETISVPINLSGNNGICGATFKIDYDEKLVLTNVEKGPALPSLTMTKPGNLSANPFNLVWDGTDADNSNGVIALLTFVLPDEDGTFHINISYKYGDVVDGTLTPIDLVLQNSSIIIGEGGENPGGDNPETGDDFVISVDEVSASTGGNVDVPIRISGNKGICGATLNVNFDSRLTLTKITKGGALSSLIMTKPGTLSGNSIKIVWDGMDPDSTNGIAAILTFTVPNSNGTYNVNLDYNDEDIVDGDLTAVNPLLINGSIKIESMIEVNVNVAGQSIKLNADQNGKILVAYYAEGNRMIFLNNYDVSSSISAYSVENASKAKVMCWNGMDTMTPICPAQTVYINQ